MKTNQSYQVHLKETLYFMLRLSISLAFYCLLIVLLIVFREDALFYEKEIRLGILFIVVMSIAYIIRNGLFVGLIRSSSVRINENQLPEIYKIAVSISTRLNLKRVPRIYLLQSGGSLNAFAKKFFRSSYIVIYSELLEAFYEKDKDAVEFVIAHELGHIKRNHFWKEIILLPSLIIPFLTLAYHRACEYTCDNIGKFFNEKGAVNGILLVASGKQLSKRLNVDEFMIQTRNDRSFWRWIVEKLLSHPSLYRRLINVYPTGYLAARQNIKREIVKEKVEESKPEIIEEIIEKKDYGRYMPN